MAANMLTHHITNLSLAYFILTPAKLSSNDVFPENGIALLWLSDSESSNNHLSLTTTTPSICLVFAILKTLSLKSSQVILLQP